MCPLGYLELFPAHALASEKLSARSVDVCLAGLHYAKRHALLVFKRYDIAAEAVLLS